MRPADNWQLKIVRLKNKGMNLATEFIDSIFQLFYPKSCACCGTPLIENEHSICLYCILDLPYTDFHLYISNSLARQFWGIIELDAAAACFHFNKGGKVQHLLHQVKYKHNQNAAYFIGELYGNILSKNKTFNEIELIVPVPIHAKKEKIRGYNQAERFASGLASSLKKPVLSKVLFRENQGVSQTFKNREERYQSLSGQFSLSTDLKYLSLLSNCKVLLVDDVITSGSTLVHCAKLLQSKNCQVSIAAIAYTGTG